MNADANTLDTGQAMPDFTLPRDGGADVSLSDFKGKKVVLYAYPKDDTSGCTREAVEFTAHAQAFEAQNAVILGISPDPVKKHDKFKTKHDLNVTLLSDEDKVLLDRLGVWVEKSMYGRKYMGVERSTFLIDENGLITHIWRKVSVPGHVEEVLAALTG